MSTADPAKVTGPRSYAELLTPAVRVQVAVVAVLVLATYWGIIQRTLVMRWLHDGNWSHGWLIPAFSLYFLHINRDKLMQCRAKPSYLGAFVVAASLAAMFMGAWVFRMAYPQALSIVGVIFGLTLLLGGWNVIRVAWFPILFLVLAVPLPQSQYVQLTMPLREFASTAAAAILPLLSPGLIAEAQAVVIDYVVPGTGPGQLNVQEACSGMRLIMAFVTLGVAMAYVRPRPNWQRVIMVLSCLPIAVLCNTIRVTTTGMFHIHGYHDLAKGTPHQLLGILMLVIALGLYVLIGYILSHLFIEESEDTGSSVASA